MELNIISLEPAILRQGEEPVSELINVTFGASLIPEEFKKIKDQTKMWAFEVELKTKKK